MYVEALENAGKFNLENGMYLKSGQNYYKNFKEELNSRNENIWLNFNHYKLNIPIHFNKYENYMKCYL